MNCLWLHPDARATIEAEARHWRIRETGGPLFGYESEDAEPVITHAFGPGPEATHHRFRHVADRDHTKSLIDKLFEEHDGQIIYLGEWHSHPLGRAKPSAQDIATLGKIAGEDGVQLSKPLAMIQQTNPVGRRVRMGQLAAFQWVSVKVQELEIHSH